MHGIDGLGRPLAVFTLVVMAQGFARGFYRAWWWDRIGGSCDRFAEHLRALENATRRR